MTEITCDGDHTYRVDGVIRPGVTEILKGVGFIDDTYYTPESSQRGTYVHRAIELYHTVGLDIKTVHKSLLPYFEGYLKFLKEVRYTNVVCKDLVEKKLYHSIYQYCGRLDLAFTTDSGLNVFDIKTGSVPWHTKYQLEGYGELIRYAGYKVHKLYALHLPGNGTYKMIQYGSARDLSVFQAATTIMNAKLGLI